MGWSAPRRPERTDLSVASAAGAYWFSSFNSERTLLSAAIGGAGTLLESVLRGHESSRLAMSRTLVGKLQQEAASSFLNAWARPPGTTRDAPANHGIAGESCNPAVGRSGRSRPASLEPHPRNPQRSG